MNSIEQRLGHLFGYEHAVLFGRARAGLVAVLEEVSTRGDPVIFPSNVCVAVLAAVVAAERTPRLAPVSAETGLADDERLADMVLAASASSGVVMPAHLYGQLADYTRTRRLAAERGWFILENDSLAATITSERKFCTFGDALLVSFGSGKTIDAGGGGAILTNDRNLASALSRRARHWPDFDDAAEIVENNLVLVRRYLHALRRERVSESVFDLDVSYCRHSLNDLQRPRIAEGLDGFFAQNEQRLARLVCWREALRGLAAELAPPTVPMPTPWRAVFRFERPQLRNVVVDTLRKSGFDAGTNYPPLTDFFPKLLHGQSYDDAEKWGQTVMTLWLDRTYDGDRIAKAAAVIEETVAGEAKACAVET
jgi:dTDP-4-amino-4,6-dideoxygalactose transaminase